MEQRRQKSTLVETSTTTDRQGQPHPRGEQEAMRDRSRHERHHHSETQARRRLARGQTAHTMPTREEETTFRHAAPPPACPRPNRMSRGPKHAQEEERRSTEYLHHILP
jgi:hypothetical protein